MSAMGAMVATIGVGVLGDAIGSLPAASIGIGKAACATPYVFASADEASGGHADDQLLAKLRINRLGFSIRIQRCLEM